MTSQPNQQTNRPHREDYKVQKLVAASSVAIAAAKRIEAKLALQAKAIREASQASSKN